MRHTSSGPVIAALAWLGLAACAVPDTAFHATLDAGGGLAIKVSTAAVDVDEGGTADFAVTLSQAPTAELIVKIAAADSASTAALGLSVPELRFAPSSFDQPQTVTVTGLVDADAADALASISLSADGLASVAVAATVHDHDKVEIATDIAGNGVLAINETSTATIHVHLTHQPAADVRVSVALGAGPVTVAPAEVTFTAANYNVDQAVTFTAPDDINIISEDESLTFRAAGLPDRLYTIHDVDKDTLNIHATPTTMSVNEGGSKQVSVTLTKQPTASTTVHCDVQLGNVTIDHTDLMFTPQNYATAQTITVSAPQDANTVAEQDQLTLSIPGSSVSSVTVAVTTIDDDVQSIIDDAPDPVSVTENQSTTFGVTLKFQPTSNVFVTVTSLGTNVATASPGTLTFTPQNYNDPTMHQVTVHGADDSNLVTDSTSIKLHEPTLTDVIVHVDVPDDDTQQIVVTPTMLSIPEGTAGSFTVALKFDPGATVSVDLANTNQTSLPITPKPGSAAITFTGGSGGNWATPVRVAVNPPADSNTTAETAVVTVSGAGAPTPATVNMAVTDSTVVAQYGWPTPFTATRSIPPNTVVAYMIHVDAASSLDSLGVYVPVATGNFRMALYADSGGKPGALVAAMPLGVALSNGSSTGDINPDVMTPIGFYWVAVHFAQTTAVGSGPTTQLGNQCIFSPLKLGDAWPATLGPASCTMDVLLNLWTNNYHQ